MKELFYRLLFILLVVIAVFLPVTLRAVPEETVDVLLFKGNQAYEKGSFDEAISFYQQILDKGFFSGSLYYNLGNAYFRKGDLGRSYWNYVRAKKYIPKDEDLFANQLLVEKLLKPNQPEDSLAWYAVLFIRVRESLSGNQWIGLAAAVHVSFFIVFLATLFLRPLKEKRSFLFIYAVVFWVGTIAMTAAKLTHEAGFRDGIILEKGTIVRYSPSFQGAAAFELDPGVQVELVRDSGEWVQIRFGRGKAGWIEKSKVGEI